MSTSFQPLLRQALLLCFSSALLLACEKNKKINPVDPPPTFDFKTKKKLVYTDSAFMISLPTAFTPNGDGVNDGFSPIATHLGSSHYQLTITTLSGTVVYQTTDNTLAWNGRSTTGATLTDYKYNVAISFSTARGRNVDTSTYLYLVPTTNTCARFVWADTSFYAFPDQLDTNGMRAYLTNEVVCP